MFFDGNVQGGIALALRESKAVVCFIRDDGSESSKWEHEYMQDAQVSMAIELKAVALKIDAGSQDAQSLAAYYPIRSVPTLIIIRNGEVISNLSPGPEEHLFKARVLTSLAGQAHTDNMPSDTQPSQSNQVSGVESPTTQTSNSPSEKTEGSQGGAVTAGMSAAASSDTQQEPTAPESSASSNRPPSAIESLLQERRRRLEADKRAKDDAEKAERRAKADARKESMSVAPDSAKAKQAKHAQEQRKRQADIKMERERVLRQIEQDKADRREKEERRKALAKAEAEGNVEEVSEPDVGSQMRETPVSNTKSQAKECAVQVRLFDGSTIRNRFPSNETLKDVRKWVDDERSGDIPYTLKQILTPLPNRSLTISEEQESLRGLDLVPSATLVMVPIQGYTAAYSGANPGLISRGLSAGYNTVATGAGMVTGALGTFLGLGQATAQPDMTPETRQEESAADRHISSNNPTIRVRTLHDQQEKKGDRQFYNGNQLNFEPRKDDDDKND